jgi:hypothetical protein
VRVVYLRLRAIVGSFDIDNHLSVSRTISCSVGSIARIEVRRSTYEWIIILFENASPAAATRPPPVRSRRCGRSTRDDGQTSTNDNDEKKYRLNVRRRQPALARPRADGKRGIANVLACNYGESTSRCGHQPSHLRLERCGVETPGTREAAAVGDCNPEPI